MWNIENFNKKLLEFGINEYEIKNLTIEEAICYFRFHHKKNYGNSSILFVGFSDEEIFCLSEKINKLNFNINKRISEGLTFICANKNADLKRIQKAKKYGAIFLTEGDLDTFFTEDTYILNQSKFLFDNSIQSEFRVIKPLSNFDKDIETESFSFTNENTYTINLYKGTCTCQDFIKKNRAQFSIGDIRRFCKHLLSEYKNSFGVVGLTEFQKSVFENGYPLKRNCQNIHLDKISLPIILNFEENDEWWNVFVPMKDGSYERYGYSSIEERFSYNDKPYGLVTELRVKLNEAKKGININTKKNIPTKFTEKKKETKINKVEKSKGCLILFLLLTIFSFSYLTL